MSILTKLLAVLLSIFSLLLAGMVVTFTATTDNYRNWYGEEVTRVEKLEGDLTLAKEQFNLQVKKTAELEADLQQKRQLLETDKNQLAADLLAAERRALKAEGDADRWKGVMAGFEVTVGNAQESLTATQKQLDKERAQNIENKKEIQQLTADLYEKVVQLESLEADRRRLLEQKKELETLLASGKAPAEEVIPVTPRPHPGQASPAPSTAVTDETDISGLVLETGQGLVTLSVGSADGVAKGTIFHIFRGSDFVCDVVVTDVEIDRCAGTLEMIVKNPLVGDTASTQQ